MFRRLLPLLSCTVRDPRTACFAFHRRTLQPHFWRLLSLSQVCPAWPSGPVEKKQYNCHIHHQEQRQTTQQMTENNCSGSYIIAALVNDSHTNLLLHQSIDHLLWHARNILNDREVDHFDFRFFWRVLFLSRRVGLLLRILRRGFSLLETRKTMR